uniref:Exocyst complex component 7 n=1 Tax=Rhabditophanes sp. KR3021 TaxID=114890 RepID=A0AC35UF29_9BILA
MNASDYFKAPDSLSANDMTKKLQKDEEFLISLESHLIKSNEINANMNEKTGNFIQRLSTLEKEVFPLCIKTDRVQKKQSNVKTLLYVIDATIQFYGKTADLEDVMKEGNAVNNLDDYLTKMDNIKEAVKFFSSHQSYESQLINLKTYYEAGLSTLEKDFKHIILAETTQLDVRKILEHLDDENEPITDHQTSLRSLKDMSKVGKCCKWLINNSRDTKCIENYAALRTQSLHKTIKNLLQYLSSHPNKSNTSANLNNSTLSKASHPTTGRLRNALRKIAKNTDSDKTLDIIDDFKDNSLDYLVASFASLLMLLEIETDIASHVIGNVKNEAHVQRIIITKPMTEMIEHLSMLLSTHDGGFLSLIPVCKFFHRHHNQLQSLCENSANGGVAYGNVYNTLNQKCANSINEYVERLQNDTSKVVPHDGNVHQITANTISVLKSLLQQKQTIINVLALTSPQERNHLPRLFLMIFSALGANLKVKCLNFQDDALASIFMINNYNYIAKCLLDPSMTTVMAKENLDLCPFYENEISTYQEKYLVSWQKVSTLTSQNINGLDRKSLKSIYLNFNREMESILDSQKNFTVCDATIANVIRNRIKDMILRNHGSFYVGLVQAVGNDKNFKYDADSLEVVVDHLFDNSN